MKIYTILIVLLVVVVAALSTDVGRPLRRCCPRNEVWRPCNPPGGGCERDCSTRDKSIACAGVCSPKCYCRRGWLRVAHSGKCVPPCKCPSKG